MMCGYFLSVMLRFNFQLDDASYWLELKQMLQYTSIHLFLSLIFKAYVGVIRYTHKEDILSLIKVFLVGGVAILALNITFKLVPVYFFSPDIWRLRYVTPYSILVIAGAVNLVLLAGYRFAVKEFFEMAMSSLSNKKRVVIFGAGNTGRVVGRIMQDHNSQYDLRFFLDDDPKLAGGRIHGCQVLKPGRNLPNVMKASKIEELIIAVSSRLDPDRRRELIEECLRLNIIIKEVPDPKRWVGGHLSERQFKEVKIEDLLGRQTINLTSDNAINSFSNKIVLVTGAAGSIGSEISNQLLRCKVKHLILLDQSESGLYDLYNDLKSVENSETAEVIIADITREEVIEVVFRKYQPEVVFHAAAYKHVPLMEDHPLESIRTNVLGTKSLVDLSLKYEVEKFIMVSTDKAVNPTNIMGATKRAAEMYVQSLNSRSKLDCITTRFGNVLGSNGSVIPLLRKQIQKGGPITITHPEITRFFMTIPEACSLVLEAGSMGKGGEIFVFDMGQPIKILDLAHNMLKLSGLREGLDIEVSFIGLRPGEKLYEEVLSDEENTKKTHHPKIQIAEVIPVDYDYVLNIVEELKGVRNEVDAVRLLKKLIPEFKSQVSRFEGLDISVD